MRASTFEDLVDARKIAIAAVATFTSCDASRASLLPLFVEDRFTDLLELFVFAGLHSGAIVQPCAIRVDYSRALRERFVSL